MFEGQAVGYGLPVVGGDPRLGPGIAFERHPLALIHRRLEEWPAGDALLSRRGYAAQQQGAQGQGSQRSLDAMSVPQKPEYRLCQA